MEWQEEWHGYYGNDGERRKCEECGCDLYNGWGGICRQCRNTYARLLAKIGPARMDEIRRETVATVDRLMGVVCR